jgi:hypothetical protein
MQWKNANQPWTVAVCNVHHMTENGENVQNHRAKWRKIIPKVPPAQCRQILLTTSSLSLSVYKIKTGKWKIFWEDQLNLHSHTRLHPSLSDISLSSLLIPRHGRAMTGAPPSTVMAMGAATSPCKILSATQRASTAAASASTSRESVSLRAPRGRRQRPRGLALSLAPARRPFVFSPRAVSDSKSSQTCLDPDASTVSRLD